MSTDRELLELAARAGGVRHIVPADGYDGSPGLVVSYFSQIGVV